MARAMCEINQRLTKKHLQCILETHCRLDIIIIMTVGVWDDG